MNFLESESYLLSLGNEVSAMKLGLESTRTLLAALGDPQGKYLKVQIAGTNGKGSVCAFLDSICRRAGIHTGLTTSPHLVSITERVKIDGTDITEEEFARLATKIRETAEALVAKGKLETVPTYFEQITAIALLAFAEAGVELAILETGLGGRLDATTAAEAEIAAITRIDLDHQKHLGDTIAKIAAEKAAIVRADSKVVALHQSREAEQAIVGRCREVGADLGWATTDIKIKRDRELAPWLVATFVTEQAAYGNVLFMGMLGEHQIENASIAIALAETLPEFNLAIPAESIISGLENARHPGRLERGGRYLFDGAHNVAGARALAAFLDEFVPDPVTMIFGLMDDKDAARIASVLFPMARHVVLTRPANPRAADPEELAARLAAHAPGRIHVTHSVADALRTARDLTPDPGIILVTGSLYLVGEVRAASSRASPA